MDSLSRIWKVFVAASIALALSLAGLGQVFAGVTVTYYHTDALGSPVAATDEAGELLWSERYKPYGERIEYDPASDNNNLYYTGKPQDAETGLTYFGARHYDPIVGRFMGVDPVGVSEGNVHSFNRYAYANNNPYAFVDPDGESPIDVVFFVADAAKLAVAIYSGTGVGAAAFDLAASAVGVVNPIPGSGQVLKGLRAATKLSKAAKKGHATKGLGKFADPKFAGQLK